MWKLMGWLLAAGLLVAVLLLLGLYLQGEIDTSKLLSVAAGIGLCLAAFFGAIGLALSPRTDWALTDDGLEHLGPSGGRETIRWERIKTMQCQGPTLLISWKAEGASWPRNRYNKGAAVLWLGRERSAEVFSIWMRRRASLAEHRAPASGGPAAHCGSSGPTEGRDHYADSLRSK